MKFLNFPLILVLWEFPLRVSPLVSYCFGKIQLLTFFNKFLHLAGMKFSPELQSPIFWGHIELCLSGQGFSLFHNTFIPVYISSVSVVTILGDGYLPVTVIYVILH